MIRSMTGYGEAELETPAGILRVEIRSVNHRFFSLNVRSPSVLDAYEERIREWLKAHLRRGHVNVTFRLSGPDGDEPTRPVLGLDLDRARQYRRVFETLRDELGLPGEVTLEMLARQPDLVVREESAIVELEPAAVRDVTDRATRAVVAMREVEGRSLRADLDGRLAAMEAALAEIAEQAPERLEREAGRLRQAVAELAGGLEIEPDRLAREIAMLADRWDISEEVVRLRSHIEHFRAMLDEDAAEPVGKRLSFLVQEMHREANTIGSKAGDAAIEHRVVAIKAEIERLREQVENVE